MNTDDNKKNQSVTRRVMDELLNADDFDRFADDNDSGFLHDTLGEYIGQLAESLGISRSDMIKNSGIERTYAYQILRGTRNATRDKVLQFAIGLGLDLDRTQDLLRKAGQSALYPRIKRDAAIIFCIVHKLSFVETQSMLDKIGESLLDQN